MAKAIILTLIAIAVGILAWKVAETYKPPVTFEFEPKAMEGKTVLVTGATSGVGLASVKLFMAGGANVIFTARTDKKAQMAIAETQEYLKEKGIVNEKISYRLVEFGSFDSVKSVANWTDLPVIDVLMNNVGLQSKERYVTENGLEMTAQVNHLGYFLFTLVIAPKLSENVRIVNIGSRSYKTYGAGFDFDVFWKNEKFNGVKQYALSKLGNMLFTQELQRRVDKAGKKWEVVSCHPGPTDTDILKGQFGEEKLKQMRDGKSDVVRNMLWKFIVSFVFTKTSLEGAATQAWLGWVPLKPEEKGKHFEDLQLYPVTEAGPNDEKAALRLWKESEMQVGMTFDL